MLPRPPGGQRVDGSPRQLSVHGVAAQLPATRQLEVGTGAGVSGLALLQCRMIAGIAHLRGYDLDDPRVRNAILLTMLGEATATVFMRDRDAHGLEDLTIAAKDAGDVVASAKAEIERHSGKAVANPGNHLRRVA